MQWAVTIPCLPVFTGLPYPADAPAGLRHLPATAWKRPTLGFGPGHQPGTRAGVHCGALGAVVDLRKGEG